MTSLGNVIGAILAQMGQGRSQADLATLAIADLYKQDPLLKEFPIPHVTLDEVEVNLKLVISESPVVKRDITPQIRPQILADIEELAKNLPQSEPTLFETFSYLNHTWSYYQPAVNHEVSDFLPMTGEIDPEWVGQGVAAIIRNYLTTAALGADSQVITHKDKFTLIECIPTNTLKSFVGQLAEVEANLDQKISTQVQNHLDSQPIMPDRLNILVTANELDNMPTDKITTMKFTLRESDRSWTQFETESGEVVDKLVPR